jgi:hypothetical protein
MAWKRPWIWFAWIGLCAAIIALPLASVASAEEVDVELVLAADGSGSIDDDELRLQRDGYASAIQSPEFLSAVAKGLIGKVAIAYVEWGGPRSQVTIVDWHIISDAASAATFADKVRTRPRGAFGYNSISAAIDYSVRLTETNAIEGLRKVIDVSGDGPNIGGPPIEVSRSEAIAKGFTINALAIARGDGGFRAVAGEPLPDYYRRAVIGGPAAFVMVAGDSQSFHDAVRQKLVQEIAALPSEPAAPKETATRRAEAGIPRL